MLHRDRRRRASTATALEAELARARSARPAATGLRHRDVLPSEPLLPPDNGARIDAIRDAIERDHAVTRSYPVLLTSLIEAADRVDSTTGVQMAYLKQWAPRRHQRLDLARARAARAAPVERSAATRSSWPRRSARSTSRTSIRRTTSTATSRTTTCGRRSSRGTRPSTTASPASASTPATASTKSVFNRRRAMPDALAAVIARRRRRARGGVVQRRVVGRRSTSSSTCARVDGRHVEVLALRLEALRRRADRHPQPEGRASGAGVAPAQHRADRRLGTSTSGPQRCRDD